MARKEPANTRVLIVDDQQDIHADFEEMLRPRWAAADDLAAAFLGGEEPDHHLPEFELLHAMGGEQACDAVQRAVRDGHPIAAAYIDIRMPPGIDGVATVRRIRAIDSAIEIVLMTAYTDTSLAEIVEDMELLHKLLYVRKPFAREEVQQITVALVEKWNLERELERRRRELTITNRRLTAVLDTIGEALAVYDDAQRVVFANRSYEDLLHASEADLKAMPAHALNTLWDKRMRVLRDNGRHVTAEAGGELVEPLEPAAATGGGGAQRSATGAAGPLYYRQRRPVHDDEGGVIGDLYVYRDLSHEVEIERMRAEVRDLRAALETPAPFAGMVGTSAAMQRVYRLMKRATAGDVTVLIRGESGTGKELVARALHANGRRGKGPFLAVNCAAVPDGLIESELFGHEQGAFTGAMHVRRGCFERAHGGTILLDEIADMKPELQARLLRVLQERELQRVGGAVMIPVDVQVIAATNRDLDAALRSGAFRADLYYRLAVFPIELPPLRERREDVPQLVDHFLEQYAGRAGEAVKSISPGALRLLLAHHWPGNVRELQGVIERAAMMAGGGVIEAADLPAGLEAVRPESATGTQPATGTEPEAGGQPGVLAQVAPLAEVERRAVQRALAAADGNVTRAARALGINRATLHRKLNRYGLAAEVAGNAAAGR
ncbi:MAG: sigma 54-interacting transcriptional regulator [Spirochaetaceae bacterium]|nr:sigma 54-interacting transcriptional regulator [Spirochaetaceae bacterium]